GLRDEGQMIDGVLDAEGVYKAKTTLDHDGVYYMHAHTTANSIHVMPKQKLTVGTPDMTKVIEEDEKADKGMMHGDSEDPEESDSDETNHNEH
ncbi:MAG: hypothetical protein RR595_06150, partial [Lysinibacillus sp.]